MPDRSELGDRNLVFGQQFEQVLLRIPLSARSISSISGQAAGRLRA